LPGYDAAAVGAQRAVPSYLAVGHRAHDRHYRQGRDNPAPTPEYVFGTLRAGASLYVFMGTVGARHPRLGSIQRIKELCQAISGMGKA